MGDFNTGAAPVGVLARALTGNVFMEENLAYMNEGDKDSYNAYKHDLKNVLRARTVNPSSNLGASAKKAAHNRVLGVVETIEGFDPGEYHNHWREYQPEGVFDFENLPREVQMVLEELFLGTAAEAAGELLTTGDGSVAGIVGIVTQMRSAALVTLNGDAATPEQTVSNTRMAFKATAGGSGINLGVAIVSGNLLDKFELMISNQTKAMRKRPGRKFMVSQEIADIFGALQRDLTIHKGVSIDAEGVMKYGGYELVINNDFGASEIMLASMTGDLKTDAIQLGTSMSADFNNVIVDKIDNFSRNMGMLLTFALDIYVVRPEEVCFYTDQAAI